jgi:hypothetical protein
LVRADVRWLLDNDVGVSFTSPRVLRH